MTIEFVSYDGEFPNYCRGILTLRIDGVEKTFGRTPPICLRDKHTKECDYQDFWNSGCSIPDYAEIRLPKELRPYSEQIFEVFERNVPVWECGGCI